MSRSCRAHVGLPNLRLDSTSERNCARFRVTITYDEQADKNTVVTMRQLLPTKEDRAVKIGFGAVELGYQTLDQAADHIRSLR